MHRLGLTAIGLLLAGAAPAEIPTARKSELIHLLKHDCGACHGMRLTGGLGPPLTATALSDKPRAFLEHAILAGRPGTPMPPWAGILRGAEVRWLVDQLRKGAYADD